MLLSLARPIFVALFLLLLLGMYSGHTSLCCIYFDNVIWQRYYQERESSFFFFLILFNLLYFCTFLSSSDYLLIQVLNHVPFSNFFVSSLGMLLGTRGFSALWISQRTSSSAIPTTSCIHFRAIFQTVWKDTLTMNRCLSGMIT